MIKKHAKKKSEYKKIDLSVIIPLYKGRKFCVRLLNMIEENCRYKDLYKKCAVEVIFINDYPNEKIIIEKKSDFFEIYVFAQEKNRGIQSSRVKGIANSKGNYIIMLDQDDLVTENWLYSQWNMIISENVDGCICNGWSGRFRVLAKDDDLRSRVNDLEYYLGTGNAILSPGQVIIRKTSVPYEWMKYIQINNGADDFLLWIMMLKKGKHFRVNNDHLYYHTPERNTESIDSIKMVRSLREAFHILTDMAILNKDEINLLDEQINRVEDLGRGVISRNVSQMNQYDLLQFENFIKFRNMFHVMNNWMRLKNKGIEISNFFKEKKYLNIAIYGMGYIGEALFDELYGSDIHVKYGIDQTAIDFKNELPVYRIKDDLENVDAVILTVAGDSINIIELVKNKLDCPVISFFKILLILESRLVL